MQTRSQGLSAIALAAVTLVTSCASYQLINPRGDDVEQRVKLDHKVGIYTTDGRQMEVRVSGMTSDTLIGEDLTTLEQRKVPFKEIGLLEKKPRWRVNSSAVALTLIFMLMAACVESDSDCVIR